MSRVEALCAQNTAHGVGNQRFQRAGTNTHTAVTTAGEYEFVLHYVEDTPLIPTNPAISSPLKTFLTSTGKTAINRILLQRASISPRRSVTVTLLITVTASR